MMDLLSSSYGGAQEWLMQNVVLPILYAADAMGYAEDAVSGLDWFLLGLIQIVIIALVFGPLEKLFPVEAHPRDQEDKRKMATARAVDIFYTVIHISPRFHRFHHAVGMGHEVPGKPGVLGGCNFGVLFPWWDMVLGTAIFHGTVYPTGVRGLNVVNNPIIHQWQGLLHSLKSFKK